MVLTHPFYCPVRCVEGHAYQEAAATILAGKPYLLVTSQGWVTRGAVDILTMACGAPAAVFSSVEPNPTVSQTAGAALALPRDHTVIALGGGSVIDAAKGISALHVLNNDQDAWMAHLRDGATLPDLDADYTRILAIPTTSGTGAEVTRWGTIWGDDGKKYSVTGHGLYPTHAIIDPALTLSMPGEVTLATGLDALSHAMEAVWNKRHGDVTDALAEQAIRLIRENLPRTLEAPEDVLARGRMQTGALLAGQAMGTTQSALAHSMSYPFTSRYGLSHGIACSFTLAEVVRYNAETEPDRMAPIARGFECELETLADGVETFLISVGIRGELRKRLQANSARAFGDALITPARAANNIRHVDGEGAQQIATDALTRLIG